MDLDATAIDNVDPIFDVTIEELNVSMLGNGLNDFECTYKMDVF